jgi:lipopolysaccharide export system protein LptA
VPASRYGRNLRRLRLALLGAVGAIAIGVAALYWSGRNRLAGTTNEPIQAEAEKGRVVSSGFDYTASEGDRPLFRIRGGQVRMEGSEKVELDDVGLTLYRSDGEVYELRGDRATYDRTAQAARIVGSTRLVGPRGMVIETEALDLQPGGRRLRSETPIRLRLGPDYRGEAQRLDADVRAETFLLAGGVKLVNAPPRGDRDGGAPRTQRVDLTCNRLLLDRSSGTAHAEGDVRLERGRDHVEARRLSLQLDLEQRRVEFLRARWDVQARFQVEGDRGTPTERARARGEALSLKLGEDAIEVMELEGKPRHPARLVALERGGGERRIESPYIVGRFAEGLLSAVEASGPVELAEHGPGRDGPSSTATGGRAEAVFRHGDLASVALRGGVTLAGEGIAAAGDSANLDAAAGRAELLGNPARAESARGTLEAPRIVHTARGERVGLLQAFGGVQARLDAAATRTLAGAGLGAGEQGGPVRVESKEAFFQERDGTFGFTGDVRAWRGEQLLLADPLHGNEVARTLAASGRVRTVWRPAGDATDGGAPRQPVEIDAASLLYREAAREAVYEGGVAARQAGRTLSCATGRLLLDDDDRLERFEATTDVRLEEPAAGRTVTGAGATYDLPARTIVVRGEPAVLVDPVRGRAEGRQIVYDLASGRVRLLAEATAAATGAGRA